MVFQEMVPWRKGRRNVNIVNDEDTYSLGTLQRRMNRMFDDFFGDFGSLGLSPMRALSGRGGHFAPRIDVSENDKEYNITAELAGMDEKDVDVTLQDGVLTVHGEKKTERDEKNDRCCLAERSYGTFSRSIVLPAEVQEENIEAAFTKGVLTIRLPKVPVEESKARKIEIKSQ